MKNFIIDVGTPIFIDALSKFGHVFEVKSGKEFSVNERLNYTEVILNYEDSVHKDYIANFLKSKNINGILSFSEDNRKYWYELAQNMDIFTNIKLPYILNQNKLFCRKKINSILKNKVRWDTINDFIGLGELQYFPIIIKPYIGKGSIDVCKCESIGEVYHVLKDKDIEEVTDVIEFFNERKDIRDLFEKLIEQKAKENSKTNVNVILGDELGIKELEDFSFVYSIYNLGGAQGIIGVMGPKRMAYSKTMGLINHVSREVNKLINSMGKEKNKKI